MKRNIDSPIPKARHIPQRTCLACHQVKNKRELVRIVKTVDGSVLVDEKGKKSGRGAYFCPAKKCWEEGLKNNRLEYVLHTKISNEDRLKLELYKEQL